jgi:hypothetical protein
LGDRFRRDVLGVIPAEAGVLDFQAFLDLGFAVRIQKPEDRSQNKTVMVPILASEF